MKIFARIFIGVIVMVCGTVDMKAQNVIIEVPATNIFSRAEFTTVKNVLNTINHTNWRVQPATWPRIWSLGDEFFLKNNTSVRLPTSVLQWQLANIGGKLPPFASGDNWPLDYKWFNTSEQTWYQPAGTNGGTRVPGNVAFNFRIPSDKFLVNAFQAGEYSIDITHNYTSSGYIEFTPNYFSAILSIPSAIQWISNTPSAYYEISSLDQYRSGPQIINNLFLAEIASTENFNLLAKASSSSILFTTPERATVLPVSLVTLESTNPKIISAPLSSSWENYSLSSFGVEIGNRNNFPLQLSISKDNFKNHFFKAGTYSFQINLEAKSTDGTVSATQNTNVTIKVLPLSEITIPTSGNAVNFVFNTFSHYNEGQTKIAPDQIKISNNETYELYVKTDSSSFRRSGIESDISSSILQIGIDGGSQNVRLSRNPKNIISNGTPVLDKKLNIKYTISPAAAQRLVTKEKSTYSINVIYSFTVL